MNYPHKCHVTSQQHGSGQEGISPLWELNSIFMNTLRKKLIVLTSNMASFSRSRIPRIWMLIIGQGNKLKGMENVLVHHLRCIKKA